MGYRRPQKFKPIRQKRRAFSGKWIALGIMGASAIGVVLSSDQPDQSSAPLGFSQTVDRPRNVFYRYCDDARAAGVAPLYRGDPGYRPALDRDDDGIACEPYYGN